jgi:hypothetical protein
MGNDEKRFWAKVRKVEGEDACWEWTGTTQRLHPSGSGGYGVFKDGGRMFYAHRTSWEMANGGPVPEGFHICHHCDNRLCVRPDHLFLGTPADNMHDRDAKGRVASGARNGSYTKPERRPHGEQHGMALVTEEQVREIRQRHANGESQTSLARVFGMTQPNVSAIVLRKIWRHVV